jgi:hypothetical protein
MHRRGHINRDLTQLWKCWGFWNKNNKCYEFLFKFYNNILRTGDRVAKFVPGHNPECTLCEVGLDMRPRPAESFCHFIFSCPYSCKISDRVEKKYFPEINDTELSVKKSFGSQLRYTVTKA